jgi:class 3 adenylate cyclase
MFEGGEAVVHVADAARARRQLVELGESNDTHFVVRSGLNEGDALLVSPPAQTQVAVAQ